MNKASFIPDTLYLPQIQGLVSNRCAFFKKSDLMGVLLTGATGHIGKRLLPILIDSGYSVICGVRDRNKFQIEDSIKDKIQVKEIDLTQRGTFDNIPKDIDYAYYLVHSMSTSKDYSELEKKSAINFRGAINKPETEQVIYLNGIVNSQTVSKHLDSRRNEEM